MVVVALVVAVVAVALVVALGLVVVALPKCFLCVQIQNPLVPLFCHNELHSRVTCIFSPVNPTSQLNA